MSRAGVLLVSADLRQARSLAQAMLQRTLSPPTLVDGGENAIAWLAGNGCGACVLSSQLKQGDLLETLARLRQRFPELPIIVVSDANSEEVAVAAFRLGVHDYVATRRGYEAVVAERLEQLLSSRSVETAVPIGSEATGQIDLPPSLLQPTYQNRLRLVGRELDRSDGRLATILEVPGGFLVRTLVAGQREVQLLEFAASDFLHLAAGAYGARGGRSPTAHGGPKVLPTGYEDFFRALGRWLDLRHGSAIQIAELDELVVVSGLCRRGNDVSVQSRSFQLLLGAEEIKELLDGAFRRRAVTDRGKPFSRLRERRLA